MPSHSLDSIQSSSLSHLQHQLSHPALTMDYTNFKSVAWNNMYWILATVTSLLILTIVCSCYCYVRTLKKIKARQARLRAKRSYYKFVSRPYTIESAESMEMKELGAVNEVPRGSDMGAIVYI